MSQLFSREDVALHDGKNNDFVWIIIHDNVYDVTNYLDDHPGGGDLITEFAGKDGTKGFDDFGHSGDANKILKRFKIGEIIEAEKSKNLKKIRNSQNGTEIDRPVKTGISFEKSVDRERKKKKSSGFLFCR